MGLWLLRGAISCLVALCTLKLQGQAPAESRLQAIIGARPKPEPCPWHRQQQSMVLSGLPAGGVQPARPSPGILVRQRASDDAAYLCQVLLDGQKKLPHFENSESCPCPAAGTSWHILQQSPSAHSSFTTEPVTFDTFPLVSSGENFIWCKLIRLYVTHRNQISQAAKFPYWAASTSTTWKKELADYKDCDILLLLCYGSPINYEGPGNLSRVCHNHKVATDFPEVEATSVIGPFKSSPFVIATTVAPLNTVPKNDSIDHRVIVDLSFPKHNTIESVNGGISRDC